MANADKPQVLVTPKGVAVWPHLHAPDTKFDAKGVFHTKLAFSPEDEGASEFLAMLEQAQEDAVAEKKKSNPKLKNSLNVNEIIKDEVDEEGDPTGRKIVSLKMYAEVTSKKTGKTYKQAPRFFDSKLRVISEPPKVSGGSILKIAYTISPYLNGKNTGITLYMQQVQVIELKEWQGGSAPAAGFGEEEGFEAVTDTGYAGGFSDDSMDAEDDGSGNF